MNIKGKREGVCTNLNVTILLNVTTLSYRVTVIYEGRDGQVFSRPNPWETLSNLNVNYALSCLSESFNIANIP